MRDLLVKVFTQLLAEAKEDFDGSCMVRLFIKHPALNHAVIIAGRTLDTLTVTDILAALDNCVQSEENLDIQESLTIQLGVAKMLRGGRGDHITNVSKDRITKKSIISINNNDSLCLARAIAVGIARHDRDNATHQKVAERRYNQMRNGGSILQSQTAREYHQRVGLPLDRQCTLNDIWMFEHELNIQVIVFAAHLGNRVVYQGVPKDKRIYLYYTHSNDGGHFDTVVKVPGLLSRGYFCHLCLKGYDKRREQDA